MEIPSYNLDRKPPMRKEAPPAKLPIAKRPPTVTKHYRRKPREVPPPDERKRTFY